MADAKLTALTATTSIDGSEMMYVVEDPSGSPLSRKVLASDIKTYMSAGTGGTPAGTTLQFQYNDASAFGGANLWRESADIIAQRNSTTAQTLQIYNTYTDASNYERLNFVWTSNEAIISTAAAGTGTARMLVLKPGTNNMELRGAANIISGITTSADGYAYSWWGSFGSTRELRIGMGPSGDPSAFVSTFSSNALNLGTANTVRWQISTSGHFLGVVDNTYDIGASGATRPRNIYVGTGVYFTEQTAPAAPATNNVVMYAEDNGAGKTRLMARFATGAAVQVAIEP